MTLNLSLNLPLTHPSHRLVKNAVLETYENARYFDVTFVTFVWIAFLPTVTTPLAFFAAFARPTRR